MPDRSVALEERVRALERKLRIHQLAALAGVAALVAAAAGGQQTPGAIQDRVRARLIEVVDDQGVVRISLGQDPAQTQRRSRACGITLHDAQGDERGGLGTMDDLSAVIALDAPAGVGDPMRDRIGMMVGPDGAARVVVIGNHAELAAQVSADARGDGALELHSRDEAHKRDRSKRVTATADEVSEHPLEERK